MRRQTRLSGWLVRELCIDPDTWAWLRGKAHAYNQGKARGAATLTANSIGTKLLREAREADEREQEAKLSRGV